MDPSTNAIAYFKNMQNYRNRELFKQAENQYHNVKNVPENFINLHIIALQNTDDSNLRHYILSLLHTHGINNPSIYDRLTPDFRDKFNNTLLLLSGKEIEHKTIVAYSHCLSAIIIKTTKHQTPFTRALDTVFMWFSSSTHSLIAFNLLSKTLEHWTENLWNCYFDRIFQVLQVGLRGNGDIASSSLELYREVLKTSQREKRVAFLQLFPSVLELINKTLGNGQETDFHCGVVQTLLQIVEDKVEGIENYLNDIVNLCVALCGTPVDNVDEEGEDVMTVGLEVIATAYEKFPEIMKQNKQQLQIYQIIFTWIAEVEDLPEWYDNDENQEDLPLYYLSLEFLERILRVIGSVNFANFLFNQVGLVNSDDWKKRNAFVLSVLITISESRSSLLQYICDLFKLVAPLSSDPHPRVRHAALSVLYRMYKYYPVRRPDIETTAYNIAFNGTNDRVARVVEQSCELLAIIIRSSNLTFLSQRLDPLLNKLPTLLDSEDEGLLTSTLYLLSNIVLKSKQSVGRYFNPIVQKLQAVIEMTKNYDDYLEVKGRAIELLSIIGNSLGGQYCDEVARIIIKEIDNVLAMKVELENTLFCYVETAFSRLIDVLKEKCSPYMQTIMPIILKRAGLELVSSYESFTTKKVVVNGKSVNIHLAIADEKVNAIRTISEIATELPSFFSPYLKQSVDVVLPQINSPYDASIRKVSSQCILSLYTTASTLNPPQSLSSLLSTIYQRLSEALNDDDTSTVIVHLITLQRIIDSTPETFPLPIQLLFRALSQTFQTTVSRLTTPQDLIDQEEATKIAREEQKFRIEFKGTIARIISRNRGAFLSCFPSQFITYTIPIVFDIMRVAEIPSRVGVLENVAELAEVPGIVNFMNNIFEMLKNVLNAKEDPFIMDMAILALGNCICFNLDWFSKEIIDEWVNLLPINVTVAGDVTLILFRLIEQGRVEWSQVVIDKAFRTIAIGLLNEDTYGFNNEIKKIISTRLKNWFGANNQLMQSVWSALPDNIKAILNDLLQ
ncbi:Importin beta-3 family protein [Entamoeba marina]